MDRGPDLVRTEAIVHGSVSALDPLLHNLRRRSSTVSTLSWQAVSALFRQMQAY